MPHDPFPKSSDNDPQVAVNAAMKRKLDEFVRAPKLTREEASELYQAAFPKVKSEK